jgi:hypothetical protein
MAGVSLGGNGYCLYPVIAGTINTPANTRKRKRKNRKADAINTKRHPLKKQIGSILGVFLKNFEGPLQRKAMS